MSQPKILIEGDLLRQTSLALVNQHLARQLEERGWMVSVTQRADVDEIDRDDVEDIDRFYAMLERRETPDVIVRHGFPPDLSRPEADGARLAYIQPWEYGTIPRAWRGGWSGLADHILVPSTYVKECYEKDRLPVPVTVVPNGIEDFYFEAAEPLPELSDCQAKHRLLFVGGTIPRKGVDALLDVYDKVFGPDDDVVLVIKDHPFYGHDISGRIEHCRNRVRYIRTMLSPAEMRQLYAWATHFVYPTRGEGFGMPLLEAMAAGLKIISVDHTGCGEFFDSRFGKVIPSSRRDLPPGSVDDTVSRAYMYEPDGMAHMLREAVLEEWQTTHDPVEEARKYTWDKVGEQYDKVLRGLLEVPVARFQPFSTGCKRKYAVVPTLANRGDLRQAAKIEGDNHRLWLQAASTCTDQPKEALSCLDQAVRLGPWDPNTWFNRGWYRINLAKAMPVDVKRPDELRRRKRLINDGLSDLVEAKTLDPMAHIAPAVDEFGLSDPNLKQKYEEMLAKKRPTISAIMIVRNGADDLPTSLGSIRPFVDEIVVVDTGSTDNSVEVAKRYADKVIERPDLYDQEKKRLQSFAEARNVSLEAATGDCIFWLDADDEVPPQTGMVLRRAVDDGVQAASFPVKCPQPDAFGRMNESVVRHYRLFPRRDDIRFVGPIHEQVAPAIAAAGVDIIVLDAAIMHHGYTDPSRLPEKYERNLGILLEHDDESHWSRFNIGTTYLLMGDTEKAIEAFESALPELAYDEAHAGKYLTTLAGCHTHAGNLDRAEELCHLAIEKGLNLVEAYHNLGGICLARRDKLVIEDKEGRRVFEDQAEKAYLAALREPIACRGGSIDADAGFAKPLLNLASMYQGQGRLKDCKRVLLQLLSQKYDGNAANVLCQVYHDLGDFAAERRHGLRLRETAHQDVKARLEEAFILIQSGRMDEAERAYRGLARSMPGHATVLTNLAAVLLEKNETDEALALLQQSVHIEPDPVTFYHLGRAMLRLGATDSALAAVAVGLERYTADARLNFLLAEILDSYGQDEELLRQLELARCLGYHGADGLLLAGRGYRRMSDRDKALEMYRRAMDLGAQPSDEIRSLYQEQLVPIAA